MWPSCDCVALRVQVRGRQVSRVVPSLASATGRVNNYITEVRIIRKGQEPVPDGFELIEKTLNGQSADLNRGLQVCGGPSLCHADAS